MAKVNLFNNLSPKTKQYLVVGTLAAVLLGVVWVIVGGSQKGPTERYNPKTDKEVNVITNSNQKNMGLDAMAGRIKHQDSQIRDLQTRLNRVVKERQTDKADTTKDQEYRERFDAMSSEINKLRAQLRDASVRGSGTRGAARGNGNEQIDNPFEVREQKRRELLGDELENSIRSSAGTATKSNGSGRPAASSSRGGALHINVIEDPEAPEVETENRPQAKMSDDNKFFLPAGSILTGTLINGADFPTGNGARSNPTPVIIRLSKEAILPNRFRSDVRECFLLASGHGVLSTERAELRGETLSCIRTDGSLIDTKVSGYVSGEDGKTGMRGRLVSKTGAMIARTMAAGFLSGMSEAFDYDPVEVLSTTATNNVQYQNKWSTDAAKGGLAKGLTKSLDRVADYYMNLADQMTPVVEISAGRQIDFIVISKTNLDVIMGSSNSEIAAQNNSTARPLQSSARR